MNVLAGFFSAVGLQIRKVGNAPISTRPKAPTQVEMAVRDAAALKRARKAAKASRG